MDRIWRSIKNLQANFVRQTTNKENRTKTKEERKREIKIKAKKEEEQNRRQRYML